MFNLFKKKEPPLPPEERLADCLKKRDYIGLARAYYNLGKAAMESGDQGKAMLWLSRADTIYSARDDIYEAMGDKRHRRLLRPHRYPGGRGRAALQRRSRPD